MSTSNSRTAQHFHGVTMPTGAHPDIRRIRRAGTHPNIHGNKLWKSSCLLIDYLQQHPPEHTAKVLDVGCGWGIAGIWCARHFGSQVTSVDADPKVFPFLDATAKINGVTTETRVSRFEKLTTAELAQYDMVIGADICFWDELAKPVGNLVNRAVNAGVKTILIADPERAPFLEMAQRAVDKHCAEAFEWEVEEPLAARGALLLIENA